MMDPETVGEVLAVAAMYDRRTVGKTDILTWGDALHGQDPLECAAAIRAHYTDSDTCERYLVPGHVLGRLRTMRRTAAEKRKNDRQQLAIEGAKETASTTPHQRYLEAKALVEQRRRELGYITDTDDQDDQEKTA